MTFHIICTGYNCEGYVEKCVQSVLKQTYVDWHLHLINDGSTDGTAAECSKWKGHEKIIVHNYRKNMAAAYRRLKAIRPLPDESVILLLGMDDELLPSCLARVAMEYKRGVWMTYGNWVDQFGRGVPTDFSFYFDENTHRNRDYRRVKYRSTAPNTFKKFLFNHIPDSDFKLDGKWIDTTTESELMFSCLELCGKDRIGVITQPIYLYNRNRPGGTLQRLGIDYKYHVLTQVMKRPKKPLLVRDEKLISVGLPVLAMPAWLAMEGLCRQEMYKPWELIVYEDSNDPNGEEFYKNYYQRLPNCKRIIYIYSRERVSLSAKWLEVGQYMDKNSLGLLLQAADCYPEPNRLQLTHKALEQGADWVHADKGYFYNIRTQQTMLFKQDGLTGLNMAIGAEVLKKLPQEDKYSGVDYWLYTEAEKLKKLKVVTLNSPSWYKGVDTDGWNRISKTRSEYYSNPKPPFHPTKIKLEEILPKEVVQLFNEPSVILSGAKNLEYDSSVISNEERNLKKSGDRIPIAIGKEPEDRSNPDTTPSLRGGPIAIGTTKQSQIQLNHHNLGLLREYPRNDAHVPENAPVIASEARQSQTGNNKVKKKPPRRVCNPSADNKGICNPDNNQDSATKQSHNVILSGAKNLSETLLYVQSDKEGGKAPRILNISSNDWANYSYYNAQSLRAAGVEVDGYKIHPHSFGYTEQHPLLPHTEIAKKINSGEYDLVQIFNSDTFMLHLMNGYQGRVVVYHTGSGYRASHDTLNNAFNPKVWKSIIALGEFESMGAKNANYISVAVDTDKLQPEFSLPKKPYRFLHCPSNPEVKGTKTIKRLMGQIPAANFRVDTKILPHHQSWQRMRDCDIYIELLNPSIDGQPYGSFGTTAAEAAALGKVVVTQNLYHHAYASTYGDCPLILVKDEADFIQKINGLLALKPGELLKLQKAHRDWAVEKHSFPATGKRLRHALEI